MDRLDAAIDGDAYTAAVRRLRDVGCRCVLRWDPVQGRCIPATGCARQDDRTTCYFVTSYGHPPPVSS